MKESERVKKMSFFYESITLPNKTKHEKPTKRRVIDIIPKFGATAIIVRGELENLFGQFNK